MCVGHAKIGVIGLGLVGSALAERLLGAGYCLLGYDIDPRACDALRNLGGQIADGTAGVALSCGRILLSLPTTDVVEAVAAQIEPCLQAGQMIIDTTTGDPERTAALGARLFQRGVQYLDATISGSAEQIRRCEVIVMAGGQAETFAACRDLFQQFARRWFHIGPWGSGARMKLVTNLVLGLNRAALAEGLALGKALGLGGEDCLEILKESMAYSRIMDTKGTKMVRGDFRPQARLSQHLKDVRLILDAGSKASIALPLSAAHRRLLEAAEAAGFGDADNSAIIRAYDRGTAEPENPQTGLPGPDR